MVNPGFKTRSRLDIELERKRVDPAAFGISPNAELPPGSETFVLYGGKKHVLMYGRTCILEFTPPEIPGRTRLAIELD
ncbi:hypothetical protein VKT23_014967 [Stygiomarasmius scandens]|uniref:Uncharacterized protein n=1 Tax=Marasmiellus scandens TaxID=2682957 RepID=A0ABR1IZ75_9AGAR